MHIMEGFLPWQWCIFWYMISLPVVAYGIFKIKKISEDYPEAKPLLAVSGAFIFVLSSIKFPSVMGSSSHATGTGLGAVLFGPAVCSVLAIIVLMFQALFLAHGGISTLGANVFSMGIMGPMSAWLIYKGIQKIGWGPLVGIVLAAVIGDLVTYMTTATQLALALPKPTFEAAFTNFMAIFAITQIPLAITEGIVTLAIFRTLIKLRPDILERLNVIKPHIKEKINLSSRIDKKHVILLLLAVIMIVSPVIYNISGGQGYFTGSDDMASQAMEKTGYQPWLNNIWEPSTEMEIILFLLQGAIGAVIIIYVLVHYFRQAKKKKIQETPLKDTNMGK